MDRTLATSDPRPVWDVAAELGEGPVWVERDRGLWFVDIKKRRIHRYDPETASKRSWNCPEEIGFIFPAIGGGFVAGLQSGLYRFDERRGAFDLIVEVEPDKPGNRLNDGVVDPSGRLWFGTMDNGETHQSGAFYCFHEGRLSPAGIGGIAITNGPAVSPDGRLLYVVDTRRGTIERAEIRDDGTLGKRQPFVRIPPDEGFADGPTVDREGNLWIALYAGWEARRYSPGGDLLERVRFPVSNITKIALGGADLRTAFATTARQHLGPGRIARQPLIGHLFAFPASVPGIPCPLVRC